MRLYIEFKLRITNLQIDLLEWHPKFKQDICIAPFFIYRGIDYIVLRKSKRILYLELADYTI